MTHTRSSRKNTKTSQRTGLTVEEKLHELEKLWGYAEVTRVLIVVTGERKYCVRNYSGSLIDEMWALQGLPGNPGAQRKIEITGTTREAAIHTAYRTMKPRLEAHLRKRKSRNGNGSPD